MFWKFSSSDYPSSVKNRGFRTEFMVELAHGARDLTFNEEVNGD